MTAHSGERAPLAPADPVPADPVLARIAAYVTEPPPFSARAYATARLCLFDALGCALAALDVPECRRLFDPPASAPASAPEVAEQGGPQGAPGRGRAGARVPGTRLLLDPVAAAFAIGTAIRWLDFNDTWLAAEWGHPSDNLGALLALADARCRTPAPAHARAAAAGAGTVRDLLAAMIQAYEIQGVLALENGFNRLGLDHVILVRVASAAVATRLLGGDAAQVVTALSHAFLDGAALRTYRQGATTGSRKSWAAGDATSRGLWLAQLALRGEMGCPAALSAPQWGFQDVVLRGRELKLAQPLGSYVVENVLFKVAYPAEFHAQTAVEAACTLHPLVAARLAEVAEVSIDTQESALRIIDKRGPLTSPADRDHCLQYMVAVALLHGDLRAHHYRAATAADPRIDRLRRLTTVREHRRYTADYRDPAKRAIGNRVQVRFADGSTTPAVAVDYPLGHPRRRAEALPLLAAKFERNLSNRLPAPAAATLGRLWDDPERTDRLPVDRFLDYFAPAPAQP